MADVHDKKTRSYNMSRIKGKDTKPEILVRKYLFSLGFRYRLHDKNFPGKPDLVFPKYRKVVFIHGCYWHGHEDCKYFVPPKTKTEWWLNKIGNNKKRDEQNISRIRDMGWLPIIIWECELKPGKRDKTFENLVEELKKQ
ncbi:DNA mismatch endonuclease Vsr [Sinomicrobium kalidii]|uniref:very short patch repair endonuclease n=1 Tax=Sinomicrobium kalidii TaxID=2900738 RepID=UPI001E3D0AE0|nr:DNA mismatch endonuclease Vsr [Sinomicrobium kalidii]UGU17950.1 DNA mismatch endonuclease Vsr [Sinomicrobium kalidii]